mmetsp:Transcript_5694/g.14613  ORF Transcript_5694/g.14613 Transcript_5694/m.14613 type:complete len:438 (-) Transcript_5694:148-1461(-)
MNGGMSSAGIGLLHGGLHGSHVGDQIHHTVGVAPLIVVPGDELDKGGGQHDTGARVKDAGVRVVHEVGGHHGVLSVPKHASHGTLRVLLHLGADLLIGSLLFQAHGEVHHRHVAGRHAEGHACELAIQMGQNLAHSLGSAGGGGDDVEGRAATATPVLRGRSVHCLLGCRCGVYGGHQPLNDAKLGVDHLGEGCQAVGGARGVGNNVEVGRVLVLVHTHHEHGRIRRRGGDNDLLGTTINVGLRLLQGGEDASGLHDGLHTALTPLDVGRVALGEHAHLLASHNEELAALRGAYLAVHLAVHGVVLEHVGHVLGVDERVVHGNDLDVVASQAYAHDEAANAAEPVDADLDGITGLLVGSAVDRVGDDGLNSSGSAAGREPGRRADTAALQRGALRGDPGTRGRGGRRGIVAAGAQSGTGGSGKVGGDGGSHGVGCSG